MLLVMLRYMLITSTESLEIEIYRGEGECFDLNLHSPSLYGLSFFLLFKFLCSMGGSKRKRAARGYDVLNRVQFSFRLLRARKGIKFLNPAFSKRDHS